MRRVLLWQLVAALGLWSLPTLAVAGRKNDATHLPTRKASLPAAAVFGRAAPSTLVVIAEGGKESSQGSAVVVGPGEAVTNYHVVEGRSIIHVRQGKTRRPAKLAAFDPGHDLALLKVDGLTAPPVVVRATETLQVGEKVYAVGAPQD